MGPEEIQSQITKQEERSVRRIPGHEQSVRIKLKKETKGRLYRSVVITVRAVEHLVALDPAVPLGDPDLCLWVGGARLDHIALQRHDPFDHCPFWDIWSTVI